MANMSTIPVDWILALFIEHVVNEQKGSMQKYAQSWFLVQDNVMSCVWQHFDPIYMMPLQIKLTVVADAQ